MHTITDYIAVVENTDKALTAAVKARIDEGYQPHGPLAIAIDGGEVVFCREMVKYAPETPDDEPEKKPAKEPAAKTAKP